MKKTIFFIAVLLIGTVFNFNAEAYAATKRTHVDQNATAYTGYTYGHGAATGHYNVQYNTVAVKKNSISEPVIPFGTTITLSTSLYLEGPNVNKSSFSVTDTGAGPGYSAYWIDVYYGTSTPTNNFNAGLFGNAKKVTYSATY